MKGALRRLDADVLGVILLCVALLPAPLLLDRFSAGLAIQVLLFAMLGVAWNLMSGFAGEFSFGHAAFFGLGAYAAAFVLVQFRASPWLGILLGAGLAAALGSAIGYLSFRYRLKGVYFALATFALAEVLRLLVNGLDALNGPRGLTIPLISGGSWAMIQFAAGAPEYFYATLGLFALGQLATILLIRSRWGLLIVATRDDELGAEAAGVDTLRYRLLAICVSATLTAIGGGYYAVYYFFINPDVAFGAGVSIAILLPAVVGGIRTLWGPVVGSLVVTLLGQIALSVTRSPPQLLASLQGVVGLDRLIYGLALVVMIAFVPRGIVPALVGLLRRSSKRTTRPAEGGYAAA